LTFLARNKTFERQLDVFIFYVVESVLIFLPQQEELVGFRGKYEFAFASLRHVCIHKEGVPDAAGGGSFEDSFTAAVIIKLVILRVDCNQER